MLYIYRIILVKCHIQGVLYYRRPPRNWHFVSNIIVLSCYFKDYIESLINKPLDKQQQEELIKIIGLKDNRNRLQKSYSTINAYLKANYNLHIEKSRIQMNKERKRVWIIKNMN